MDQHNPGERARFHRVFGCRGGSWRVRARAYAELVEDPRLAWKLAG